MLFNGKYSCLFIALFSFANQAHANLCKRSYILPSQAGQIKLHSIRLVNESWEIGTQEENNIWSPLDCDPGLNQNFFDATNTQQLEEEGEAHIGKFASFIFYPSLNVPEGVTFVADPERLFGEGRIELNFANLGQIFLDGSRYEKDEMLFGALRVKIYSEPSNPAKTAAVQVLGKVTQLFAHAAEAMSKRGTVRIVLSKNDTEHFKNADDLWPNGVHDPQYLWAVLFSKDGVGDFEHSVLQHSFHEIGGLFRIPEPVYSQGLTWMVSYDQMENLAASSELKAKYECMDVQRVISNIDSTASQNNDDFSKTIEYYAEDPINRNGWPMYAWGSAYYWKKINKALESKGLPTIYQWLDSIHQFGLPSSQSGHSLDSLIESYGKISKEGLPEFKKLVTVFFRSESLSVLLTKARQDRKSLGCAANTTK